jgi:DNA-binding protein Fis
MKITKTKGIKIDQDLVNWYNELLPKKLYNEKTLTKEQENFLLKYYNTKRNKEIAEKLGMNRDTLRKKYKELINDVRENTNKS